ncbi:hypothetical protein SAMN05216344_11249 [Polaromonas sp. OV174]|nr:hypothetical protein SAMN05216344_11249 [Polaromonas sp. OV174]
MNKTPSLPARPLMSLGLSMSPDVLMRELSKCSAFRALHGHTVPLGSSRGLKGGAEQRLRFELNRGA